jgi:hypothetical protein
MSAYKIQTPGDYPEGSIQHSEHGESLKSNIPPVPVSLFVTLTQPTANLPHAM